MKSLSNICLACPRSCNIRPQIAGLPGQKLCPQGSEFLQQELIEPRRHFFATVREQDDKIYAYRTIEAISLKEINEITLKLREASTPTERNQIHVEFCLGHKILKTCIDLTE